MELKVVLTFSRQEKKTVGRYALCLLNLIEDKYSVAAEGFDKWVPIVGKNRKEGVTRFDEIAKAVRIIAQEGTGITIIHLNDAIEGLEALRDTLGEIAQWTEADWGLAKAEQLPLRQRMRVKAAMTTGTVVLIADPPRFVRQMAELRQSQILGVEECIALLQDARYRLLMVQATADENSDDRESDE